MNTPNLATGPQIPVQSSVVTTGHDREDRGQAGIGTLIIFIAMVLVASIAAGVLINTAGFLQSQSEETGQEAGDQVSDRLLAINTVGDHVDGGEIPVINMTVRQASGSSDIDLTTTTVRVISEDAVVTLVHAERVPNPDSDGAVFATTAVEDDDGSIGGSYILNSPEDRAVIMLDLGDSSDYIAGADASDVGNLTEGESAIVEITTQSGSVTTETLTVPSSLSNEGSVSL